MTIFHKMYYEGGMNMHSSETNNPLFVITGETFNVSLASNPTTGYEWRLTRYPPFIRLLKELYYPQAHPEGMVGTGGIQVFILTADYAGEGMLHFDYVRPWGGYGGSKDIYVIARDL
jgi:inhibitor of cysteine peptidase